MPVSPDFVNRTEEIDQITALVETLKRNTEAYLPQCIVNLHGPPGIGKTALLQQLRDRLRGFSTPLLIDLHASSSQGKLVQEKLAFLTTAIQELERLPEPPDMTTARDALALAEMVRDDAAVDETLTALLAALRQRSRQRVLLLLIDSCEHASEALFAWLERFFLLPLVHDPGGKPARVVAVFASQIVLRWRQHNVRRRVQLRRLEPLSLEATQEQAGDEALGSALYELTSGYPLANRVGLAYLEQQRAPRDDRRAWLTQHQPHLMEAMLERLRQHTAESRLTLEPQPVPEQQGRWDSWAILKPLAVLREFDVSSMREILGAYDDRYRSASQSDWLITIRELLQTRLIEWNSSLRAYQIAPVIRQIFARALALHQPEAYARLRSVAADYYKEQIGAVPGNRHIYIVEYVFQRLSHPDVTPDAVPPLLEEIAHLLAKYYANADRSHLALEGLAALEAMLNDGQQSEGQELRAALARLGYPPEALLQIVQNFRQTSIVHSSSI
jgi:hypothetical protein